MTFPAREARAALLLLLGCAGGGEAARRDLDALRTEVRALRSENEELSRKVNSLTGRVEVLSTRLGRTPAAPDVAAARPPATAPGASIVPPDLRVVRVEPQERRAPRALPQVPTRVLVAGQQRARRAPPPVPTRVLIAGQERAARTPPPVPTGVPIAEPDPARLEAIGRGSGREIGAEADDELKRGRKLDGASRAHALEDFVGRYPRHPSADNALVEAAAAYADVGHAAAACALARRATSDYPAGDAMSEALERLAWCEARSGSSDAERRLLERLVSDFPSTPAAERASTRLATISGGDPPAPARSGP